MELLIELWFLKYFELFFINLMYISLIYFYALK